MPARAEAIVKRYFRGSSQSESAEIADLARRLADLTAEMMRHPPDDPGAQASPSPQVPKIAAQTELAGPGPNDQWKADVHRDAAGVLRGATFTPTGTGPAFRVDVTGRDGAGKIRNFALVPVTPAP